MVLQAMTGPTLKGIDISSYEPDVNWNQVKAAGEVFAIIKCSEGLTMKDRTFISHWMGAASAGIKRAPYHFLHPSKDGAAQFEFVKTVVGPVHQPGDLGLAVDLEWADNFAIAGKQGATMALEMLTKAKSFFGAPSILYTNRYFFEGIPADLLPEFEQFPLWISAYVAGNPRVPAPWSKPTFWQYTDHEAVPGIGKIDASLFFGNMDQLNALCRKA